MLEAGRTMEFKAIHRYADMSARKIRPFATLIRGRPADEALELLRFLPNKSARLLEQVLKSAIARARSLGFELRTGVECEFFLVSSDGQLLADPHDRQAKPCYDQQALMRRYDLIAEISQSMADLGWNPYQTDHEDANGQFEMNWQFADALDEAEELVEAGLCLLLVAHAAARQLFEPPIDRDCPARHQGERCGADERRTEYERQ